MPERRMQPKKQILFVIEGKDTEPRLINAALEAFGVNDERYAILTFNTNIHTLLKRIADSASGQGIDFEAIDFKEVLAEMLEAKEGSLSGIEKYGTELEHYNDTAWLREARITDTFLLFDLDPHASEYNPADVFEFQRHFVDSSGDLGRLLLSYPMIEACRESCAFEIEEFLDLNAREPLATYKDTVDKRLVKHGLERFQDLRKYRGENIARGMAASLLKAQDLTTAAHKSNKLPVDLAKECDELDLAKLLGVEQKHYEDSREVFVLSTSLFFLTLWPREVNNAWKKCRSQNMM